MSFLVDHVRFKRIGSRAVIQMNRMKREREIWSAEELEAIGRAHPGGLTVQEIVQLSTARGERLSEAAFRKYVQLGLLPRSVRVGRQGKQRGSRGLYPRGDAAAAGSVAAADATGGSPSSKSSARACSCEVRWTPSRARWNRCSRHSKSRLEVGAGTRWPIENSVARERRRKSLSVVWRESSGGCPCVHGWRTPPCEAFV